MLFAFLQITPIRARAHNTPRSYLSLHPRMTSPLWLPKTIDLGRRQPILWTWRTPHRENMPQAFSFWSSLTAIEKRAERKVWEMLLQVVYINCSLSSGLKSSACSCFSATVLLHSSCRSWIWEIAVTASLLMHTIFKRIYQSPVQRISCVQLPCLKPIK